MAGGGVKTAAHTGDEEGSCSGLGRVPPTKDQRKPASKTPEELAEDPETSTAYFRFPTERREGRGEEELWNHL